MGNAIVDGVVDFFSRSTEAVVSEAKHPLRATASRSFIFEGK